MESYMVILKPWNFALLMNASTGPAWWLGKGTTRQSATYTLFDTQIELFECLDTAIVANTGWTAIKTHLEGETR